MGFAKGAALAARGANAIQRSTIPLLEGLQGNSEKFETPSARFSNTLDGKKHIEQLKSFRKMET